MNGAHGTARTALRHTRLVALPLAVALALALAGCSGPRDAIGSGKLVTRRYDLTGVTKVRAGWAFEVTIVRGEGSEATVTVDDNLVSNLRVRVDGDTLELGYDEPDSGFVLNPLRGIARVTRGADSATLKARVTLPGLQALDVRDASRTRVEGFESPERLDLRVADAGRVDLAGVRAGEVRLVVSDAARAYGGLETRVLSGRVSDVADVSLRGSAAVSDVAVADIAHFDLREVTGGTPQ